MLLPGAYHHYGNYVFQLRMLPTYFYKFSNRDFGSGSHSVAFHHQVLDTEDLFHCMIFPSYYRLQ